MKYLQLYENFEDIKQICDEYGIHSYEINKDGSIDVSHGVDISFRELMDLPLTFNKIDGDFDINDNRLTSLSGCPKTINGDFYCNNNYLTTLIDGPEFVHGVYSVQYNELTDMTGFPKYYDYVGPYLFGNPVCSIIYLVEDEVVVKFIRYLNEFDVIREGNIIIKQRLEEAYWMATKTELTRSKFKGYKVI